MNDLERVIRDLAASIKKVSDRVTELYAQLAAQSTGVTDHGALTGLGDDDHTQYHTDARGDARYALIAKGVTNGDSHDHAGGDGAQVDHGGLGGLSDDDHSQYHNNTRGDARYTQYAHAHSGGGANGAQVDHGGLGGLGYDDHTQYHNNARGDARYLANNVTYYVDTSGDDGNSGGVLSPLLTIQAAIDKFAGRVLSGCVIEIGEGTYAENVDLTGCSIPTPNDLIIRGDATKMSYTAGVGYMHGGVVSPTFSALAGSGTISIATTNDAGQGNRVKITVTGSVGNPDFGTDGVSVNAKKMLIWNGTTLTEYTIWGSSGNVIWLTDTNTAPALNVNGRMFVILPLVRVAPAAGIAFNCAGGKCTLRGIAFEGVTWGAMITAGAAIQLQQCVFRHSTASSYYGAMGIVSNSYVGSLGSAVSTFLGKYMALSLNSNCYFEMLYATILSSSGQTGIRAVFGANAYADYCNICVGTGTGAYSGNGSEMRFFSTNGINFATTKFSPATTDTLGNSNGFITFN